MAKKDFVLELRSKVIDVESKRTIESKKETLRTLPSFQGEYEVKSVSKKIPSQMRHLSRVLDVGSVVDLFATPIRCTLPLAKLLRAKPKLWKEVGQLLKHIGIDLSLIEKAM